MIFLPLCFGAYIVLVGYLDIFGQKAFELSIILPFSLIVYLAYLFASISKIKGMKLLLLSVIYFLLTYCVLSLMGYTHEHFEVALKNFFLCSFVFLPAYISLRLKI